MRLSAGDYEVNPIQEEQISKISLVPEALEQQQSTSCELVREAGARRDAPAPHGRPRTGIYFPDERCPRALLYPGAVRCRTLRRGFSGAWCSSRLSLVPAFGQVTRGTVSDRLFAQAL